MTHADPATIAHYDRTADAYVARTVGIDLGQERQRFLELVPLGGVILDVGSGSGRDLKAFRDAGYRPIGIEPSRELAVRARAYSGQPCVNVDLAGFRTEQAFDGVWACASLLHLRRDEFAQALELLANLLKPDGVLYVSVREGTDERRLSDGRYFTDHTAADLRQLGDEVASLTTVDAWSTPDRSGSDVRWANLLARRKPRVSESATASTSGTAIAPQS